MRSDRRWMAPSSMPSSPSVGALPVSLPPTGEHQRPVNRGPLGLVDVLGIGQAQLGEPPGVDPYLPWLGLLGAQDDLAPACLGDVGAGSVLHALSTGLIECPVSSTSSSACRP